MNILIISNCPLAESQGSGYVISSFAKGYAKRGFFVKTLDPSNYILFPYFPKFKRLRLFIGYTLIALKTFFFDTTKFDVIELWGGVGWLSCLIISTCKPKRILVICRSNGLEPHVRQKTIADSPLSSWRYILSLFESFTDILGFRRADTLTVVSKYDYDYALQHSYQVQNRLVMLENALEPSWLNQCYIEGFTFTVGFVGTWTSRKGINQLVSIINTLSAMGSNCKWLIVGVGELGKTELLQRTNLSSSCIYPSSTKDDLIDHYRAMSIFLSLSSYESFGLVCAEALCFGCVLLSTKVGFCAGLNDGIEYISIDRCDIINVAKLLRSIELNPSKYSHIAENGYNRVQGLSWDGNVEILINHYSRLALSASY